MSTQLTDFSDAREVLLDVRAREQRASAALDAQLVWDAEWLRVLCDGSGFWSAPMVRSQGHLAVGPVRGFAASGHIVNGRGVARESRFEVIP
jgi:hypothetical protein